MAFWTENFSGGGKDPKRNFRFTVQITGLSDTAGGGTDTTSIVWYAKTATKPGYTINSVEHKYLGHTFNYPGSVTWGDVDITVVDPTDPDVAGTLASIVTKGGYVIPANTNTQQTISKAKAVSALQSVIITQIDSDGQPVESWTLWNAFITEVQHGTLDYTSDELTEYTIKFKYDWAQLTDASKTDHFTTTTTSS